MVVNQGPVKSPGRQPECTKNSRGVCEKRDGLRMKAASRVTLLVEYNSDKSLKNLNEVLGVAESVSHNPTD